MFEGTFIGKGENRIPLPTVIKTGVYLVKLQTIQGMKSKKILINK